jgi:hypothetical protein
MALEIAHVTVVVMGTIAMYAGISLLQQLGYRVSVKSACSKQRYCHSRAVRLWP